MGYRPLCLDCHARLKRMRRVFCWFPTRVYWLHRPELQDGCRWLVQVLRDTDGKHYVEDLAL